MSQRNVTVVAGLSGYGKNSFVVSHLINRRPELTCWFLFDPDEGEFKRGIGEWAQRLGLEPTRTLFQMATHLVNGRVAFDPHKFTMDGGQFPFEGEPQRALDFFAEWAFEKSKLLPGEKVFVVNEMYNYCSPQFLPACIRKIAFSGRGPQLQLFLTCHEPHRLHGSLRSAMSEVVCFRLQGKESLQFAKDNGFDPAEVSQLPPLHFVARNMDSGGELRGTVRL